MIAMRHEPVTSKKLTPYRASEIAHLNDLPRASLIECWVELHGSAPLKTMTKDLLVRGIAYGMQDQQIGGLTAAEKKELVALAQGRRNPNPGAPKTGTRFYRSWRGVTHEVLVVDQGYSRNGKTYASLSEVARAITGTRWSGPRFFGIKV
jgi:hypothetical protein